jgi:hypothetical protein
MEDESLHSDDLSHALPHLSLDVILFSSLGSAPEETCSSSVVPESGDDNDDLGHSLDQPSPAAILPSLSASSGKTIEVSSFPSISLPSSILVRKFARIHC